MLLALPGAACAAQLEVLTLLNWQRVPVGEQAVAEGGAVVARADGPSAGYGNPAGLADLARPTVSGTVNVVEYTRVASRTPGGTAEADDIQLKPNFVGFANALEGGRGGWAFTLASPVTWSCGLEVRTELPAGTRRDDGRSSLELTSIGLAWGGRVRDDLRLGCGLEAWMADYRYDSGTSAHDATTVLTATYTERGRQLALRAVGGAQWEVGTWRLGGTVRSPGLSLVDNGAISTSSTSGDATAVVQTEISDADAAFAIPLPWQVVVGAAWLPEAIPGLALEADLAIHGGSGRVEVFNAVSGSATTISGLGTSVTSVGQEARTVRLKPVFNPRAGLRYRFPGQLLGHTVHGHLGGYIEMTPIEESDVFSQLDMLGATGGVSFEKGPMQVMIAGTYVTSGTLVDAIGFVESPGAGLSPEITDPDASYAVRTFSLVIGSAYRF